MGCSPPGRRVYPEGALIKKSDLDELLRDVGDTLNHIRVAQRVEMADLAYQAQMSPAELSSIEGCALKDFGLRQLYAVSSLLGVRLSDILEYSECYVLEGKSPWSQDGTNSPLVEAIFSTAPKRGSLAERSQATVTP